MLRTILKAILIAIIVGVLTYVVGYLLVATSFPVATSIGELLMKFAVGVGIISGLWYAVNGGWTWSRGRT